MKTMEHGRRVSALEGFRSLAVPGSRWLVTAKREKPYTATIMEGGPNPRYRWYSEVGGWSDRTRMWLPHEGRLRFKGNRLKVDTGERWEYLGPPVGPLCQPAVPREELLHCKTGRLLPGDVLYGWGDYLAFHGRTGYTVASVERDERDGGWMRIDMVEGWSVDVGEFWNLLVVPARYPARCTPAVTLPPAREIPTRVYIGAPTVAWLGREDLADVPKCLSRNRAAGYKGRRLPQAACEVLYDSGGFMELKTYGRWRQDADAFVAETRANLDQIGWDRVVAVVQQDWMCEDVVIDGGSTREGRFVGTRQLLDPGWRLSMDEMVLRHQELTVENWVLLRRIAPDLKVVPVLQGQTVDQYLRHLVMFHRAGMSPIGEPLIGLGSVCRRQGTAETAAIVRKLAAHGTRLHGFGVGVAGLSLYGNDVVSTDSTAWSFGGRMDKVADGLCPHGVVKHEANCPVAARLWWDGARRRLAEAP